MPVAEKDKGSKSTRRFMVFYFVLFFVRSTAIGPQNTKMKHKNVFISAAIVSVFYFLYMPRYGLGE